MEPGHLCDECFKWFADNRVASRLGILEHDLQLLRSGLTPAEVVELEDPQGNPARQTELRRRLINIKTHKKLDRTVERKVDQWTTMIRKARSLSKRAGG